MIIVVLHSVSTDYREILLDCLCDHLRQLKFLHCRDVDPIAELFPIRLDCIVSLTFHECRLTPISDAAALDKRVSAHLDYSITNKFLPKLKELQTINTCLGYWSRLFEFQRPSLKKMYLHCCHIGLPSVSRFDWGDAPNQWPSLQVLGFHCAVGRSTLNTLKAVAPHLEQFQQLQEISIPGQIMLSDEQEEEESVLSLVDVLAQVGIPLSDGLQINVDYYPSSLNCHFQQY